MLQVGATQQLQGSLDIQALVPWHHVGGGTRADLSSPTTRRPHTAGSSRSGGQRLQGSDFLSRLQADLRRRQQGQVCV
jgi:hypothetical protein